MRKTVLLVFSIFVIMLALVSCLRPATEPMDIPAAILGNGTDETESIVGDETEPAKEAVPPSDQSTSAETKDSNTETEPITDGETETTAIDETTPPTEETAPPETEEISIPSAVIVPILMFHDVKTFEGGTWSMSAENFRSTLEFLLEKGYTPVSLEQLVDYVDGVSALPEKPVCITLDDGYYSNYRHVLPILTELQVPVTVFMTCGTIRPEGVSPSADENILSKMSLEELRIMQASPFVEIQSHTYALHGRNTSYGDMERDTSKPLATESEATYKEYFSADCASTEAVLRDAGVEEPMAFSYPSGKYHPWAEEVLWERGYRVSVTTDYSRTNWVVRGDRGSLRLLGRMNVNDETTEADLLLYLERQ